MIVKNKKSIQLATALAAAALTITTANAQNIFVANQGSTTVSEFNSSGTVLNASFASGLEEPEGLAFDSSGDLYVANYVNSTVSEFNSSGTLLNASFASGLSGPYGLAIDSSGDLYVANESGTVSEFNSSGTLINTISDPSLHGPGFIAIAASRTVNLGGTVATIGFPDPSLSGDGCRRRREESLTFSE